MKKNYYYFLLLLLLVPLSLFSQHEGIERHFNSYVVNIIPAEDTRYFDDTLTNEFHLFLPQQRICTSNLGFMNPGTPFISALFSKQPSHEFQFFSYYYPFIQHHSEFVYFDARKPFTLFKFRGGGKINEYTGFLHTQNINPQLNFVFNYDVINSDGLYQYNSSKVHALGFGTAYTKRKYQSYFNFIFNSLSHRDNGGIKNEEVFESGRFRSDLLDVNLYNAGTKLQQLGVQYNQEYRIGKYQIDTVIIKKDTSINKTLQSKFSIIHQLSADRYYRIYFDKPSNFYSNIYRDSLKTFDSISYKTLNNNVLLKFDFNGVGKIQSFVIYAGIQNFFYKTVFHEESNTYLSNYIFGNISLNTQKLNFSSDISYCILGADIFDTQIQNNLTINFSNKNSFNAYFNFFALNPNIFTYYFKSNHFEWDNWDVLKKTNTLSMGAVFDVTKYSFEIGTDINVLRNYIVYDYKALPVQISSLNLVAEAYIKKNFLLRKLHWDNTITYQYISNRSFIPLPEFVGYSSIYYMSPIFKGVMILQAGIDLKIHSSVYAYAYMPATGVFYLQDKRQIGDYPNFGFHIVTKVKRFRGFVKISNVNSVFMRNTYYLLYRIPDNPFSLNFGISWEFYD